MLYSWDMLVNKTKPLFSQSLRSGVGTRFTGRQLDICVASSGKVLHLLGELHREEASRMFFTSVNTAKAPGNEVA